MPVDPKTLGGWTAFPRNEDCETEGLTVREYIATRALQGLLAGDHMPRGCDNYAAICAKVAARAVQLADALVAELAK